MLNRQMSDRIPGCPVRGWKSWRRTKKPQLEAMVRPVWQYPRDKPQMPNQVLELESNNFILYTGIYIYDLYSVDNYVWFQMY